MASRIFTKRSVAPAFRRAFSVAAPPTKPYFLVIIPDKPGSTNLRAEARPTHLQDIFPNVEKGSLKIGGPLFENAPQPNGSPSPTTIERKIFGSCVIWSADSQEEVLDALKKDIYVEKGVWDFDKVQIYPFSPTFAHQFDNQ